MPVPQEIKFGDNDTLSAITSNMVHADYLFLMTDVDCLYTDNPRKNPDAKAVRVVKDIAEVRKTGACPSGLGCCAECNVAWLALTSRASPFALPQ